MSVRAIIVLAAALLAAAGASAQGFAGLGGTAEGFAVPDPAARLAFPADHGAHPAFRVEWWYLTANLTGDDGNEYGAQWTLFRTALAPGEAKGWASPQIWLGHAAITAPERQFVAETRARGGVGLAGASPSPFAAWIDDWSLEGVPERAMTVRASGAEFSYSLSLAAGGPLVLQGSGGYSVKSPDGQASHYYSQPFLTVSGQLDLPGRQVAVTGTAWLDREWSSQPLAEDQAGWDWVSLHFDSGDKLMGFRLRNRAGGDFTAATWIAADGVATPYPDGALAAEPLEWAQVAGRRIPVRWRLRLPDQGMDVALSPVFAGAWMAVTPPYWEGPVTVTGSHAGRGYLEMTGY